MSEFRQTSECIKREFEKTSGVHESSPASPRKKCAMKMKEEKNDCHVNFCDDRKALKGCIRRMAESMSINFRILILQTMKVLIL